MNESLGNQLAKDMADSILLLPTNALPIALALLHNVHDGKQIRAELRTSTSDAVARRYGREVCSNALMLARQSDVVHASLRGERHLDDLPERARAPTQLAHRWFDSISQAAFESVGGVGRSLQ